MVSVGTHRLHVVEAGVGRPTVVFEAALGASSISWALVQPEIARLTRTVAYDRAGMGFSELGPEPRTVERIVEEMHSVLEAVAAAKPYVLVGHSYGGMSCQLFAAKYPEEVCGDGVVGSSAGGIMGCAHERAAKETLGWGDAGEKRSDDRALGHCA